MFNAWVIPMNPNPATATFFIIQLKFSFPKDHKKILIIDKIKVSIIILPGRCILAVNYRFLVAGSFLFL
jgi:hypothetical protein